MATLEQVEKLREKANVSYDEAKAALDATNGDLLDALIYLERQGKVNSPAGGGFYTSETDSAQVKVEPYTPSANEPPKGETFSDLMKRFWKFCKKIVHKGNTNNFVVMSGSDVKLRVPITVFVLLILFAFWVTVPLMIIGLFFSLRYRFTGPDVKTDAVNDAMDAAASAADSIKKSVNN